MSQAKGVENLILHELERQAKPGDVILQGVRFTDPKNGDVEADFIVLMPDLGAAVIEVKGGLVSYHDGEWTLRGLTDENYKRRIHPVDQARKAKHSLRRYLDRQPEWSLGLIRSAWFVLMPETQVSGDFGPEGLADQLLGTDQIPNLREHFRSILDRGLLTEPRPTSDDIEDAVSLLFRSDRVSIKYIGRPLRKTRRWNSKAAIAIGAGAAVIAGVGIGAWTINSNLTAEECSPHYQPCLPIVDNLNCSDIGFQVKVIDSDIYRLDRDGNGIGCESFPPPDL